MRTENQLKEKGEELARLEEELNMEGFLKAADKLELALEALAWAQEYHAHESDINLDDIPALKKKLMEDEDWEPIAGAYLS